MASEVDIANRALSMLGEIRITSLDDDNKPARAMKARYELLRDAELTGYKWRFAVKRVSLAASTDVPAWGYSLIYNRPVDDLSPIKVGGAFVNAETIGVFFESTGISTDQSPYEIIEGRIHTNISAPLDYEYIAKITDVGQFDALFVQALAARLASDAAEELTQSNTKAERADRHYKQILSQARRMNSLYRPPHRRQTGRWMASRATAG